MKKYTGFYLRCLLGWACCLGGLLLSAQGEARWSELIRAEQLLTTAHYDSAVAVLDAVTAGLPPGGEWVGEFRLQLRLKRAEALAERRSFGPAAAALLRLIDDAERAGQDRIRAEAYLHMALIHQRQQEGGECLRYLALAGVLIERAGLGELSARLNNRRAAYQRNYGTPEQSHRYAMQALAQARERNDGHQLALAHFNLSLYYQSTDPATSEYHLEQAAQYYHHTGSAADYLVMTLVLNGIKIQSGRMKEALLTNDSALVYARVMNKDSTFLSRVYDYRATALRALGQSDSAWHYLNLASTARFEHQERTNRERAVEVESRYRNEKNRLLIAEQQRQLEYAQQRQMRLVVFIFLGAIALALVYYYNSRLHRAKSALDRQHLVEAQNEELAASVKEQVMLRGEVHHRVKNNLQIIIGLLELQKANLSDPLVRSNLDAMAGRIYSMATVHEALYQQGRAGEIDFGQYAYQLFQHYELLSAHPGGSVIDLALGTCWFNLETAIPLSTIFNELLTNSFKYAGGCAGKRLCLRATLTESEGGEWCLEYGDNGPGFSEEALAGRQSGLGSVLLRGLSRQLEGRVEMHNAGGAVTRIFFRRKNAHLTPAGPAPAVRSALLA